MRNAECGMRNRGWIRSGVGWKAPALTCALVCFLLQSTALQNRSFDPDEGMRVYCARQLLDGQTPYEDFWDHKDPSEWILCSLLLKVFGDSLTGLRLGVNVLRALLIYHLVGFAYQSRMSGNLWLLGGLSFVLLAGETIQGNTAAMEIPGLLMFLVAMRLTFASVGAPGHLRSALLIASGTCAGLGILIKATTALSCLIPLLLLLVLTLRSRKLMSKARVFTDTLTVTIGLLIPVAAIAGWCLKRGILDDWLFILTVYNPAYSQGIPHWEYLAGVLPSRIWFLLPFAALALLGLFQKNTKETWLQIWIGIWLVCACLSVCVGWRFYPHYFLLLAPPLAFLGAGTFNTPARTETKMTSIRSTLAIAMSLVAVLVAINVVKWYIIDAPRWEPPRIGFFTDESIVQLASHIRETTAADDTIYVLGYCPDILVLADRRSASRYVFKLPLAAEHSPIRAEAQQEVLDSLRRTPPQYVVVMKHDWTPQHPVDSDRFVRDWRDMSSLLAEEYRLVDSEYLFDLYEMQSGGNVISLRAKALCFLGGTGFQPVRPARMPVPPGIVGPRNLGTSLKLITLPLNLPQSFGQNSDRQSKTGQI